MADKSEVNPFDYDADAGDRIWRLLEIRNIAWRDRLKQSADTAGTQLEWAKPTIIGSSIEKGKLFYAGPAVMFPPGTVIIVLAQGEKHSRSTSVRSRNIRLLSALPKPSITSRNVWEISPRNARPTI